MATHEGTKVQKMPENKPDIDAGSAENTSSVHAAEVDSNGDTVSNAADPSEDGGAQTQIGGDHDASPESAGADEDAVAPAKEKSRIFTGLSGKIIVLALLPIICL